MYDMIYEQLQISHTMSTNQVDRHMTRPNRTDPVDPPIWRIMQISLKESCPLDRNDG